jgi:ABC-type polar amino acid transport system ATPase subunit
MVTHLRKQAAPDPLFSPPTRRDLAGRGLTMIVVTHEISFAKEAADRVVFMDGGIVVEQGRPRTF